MADIKEPPKKGLIRGLLGRKEVPKSKKKEEKIESGHRWKKVFGYEYSNNDEMEKDMIESYLKKID